MSDAISAAKKVIEARLREIADESRSLERAIANFGGAPSKRVGSRPTRPKRRSRKRAPRGQRREQFLAAVKSKPGLSAAELGQEIGISTNHAHALGQRLLKAGEVKKSGKGFKPS